MSDSLVRVGHYELLQTIGKGNFAIVKLARHALSGHRVAVKIVDLETLDAEQTRKLWREVDVLKRVQTHPNILRLFQVMQSNKHVMLVTEYCQGGELFEQLVANGRMSENVARRYFRQIVASVEFLHSRGIVHRDLKAENLLLSFDLKRIVLADFGFSNYYSKDALLSTWCGSPPYAAPELFEGKRYSGPKADIWSLGVVLYVLTCGALPFDGTTLQSLRTRVLAGKFRIPYFMSNDCEHLLRHMLVVEPEKRWSIHQINMHRWMRDDTIDDDSNDNVDVCVVNDSTTQQSTLHELNMNLAEWIANELQVEVSECIESVKGRKYDSAFALYSLMRDCWSDDNVVGSVVGSGGSHSSPPSPPLLPVLPQNSQRKSSITTGIVEKESPTNHHSTHVITPPLLFLTPPISTQHHQLGAISPNNQHLNYTKMDLLKPPPTFLVNSNMGRRASDGQANYTNIDQSARAQAQSATFHFATNTNNGATTTTTMLGVCGTTLSSPTHDGKGRPPLSLGAVVQSSVNQQQQQQQSRQHRKRHSLTEQTKQNHNKSGRRRASDGASQGNVNTLNMNDITSLQSELRHLCVSASSPPSLQTSPIHQSHVVSTATQQQKQQQASAQHTTTTSPPSSPPVLPVLPEHAITPPHLFRSPTPTLTLTDSDGIRNIIAPPIEFNDSLALHRWHFATQHNSPTNDSYSTTASFATACRPQTTSPTCGCHSPHVTRHTHYNSPFSRIESTKDACCLRQASSLQQIPHFDATETDNFVFDEKDAQKLRLDLLRADCLNVGIELEWVEASDCRRLVIRRVSGDSTQYQHIIRNMVAASTLI